MKIFKKQLIFILVFSIILSSFSIWMDKKEAEALTSKQKANADEIAKVVSEHYEQYGVLPSIAIAQAMQESELGKHCPNYNMWGLSSGAIYCSSVEDGTIKYMKCINNDYYKGAPFEKDWKKQIRKILDGGYCQPEDDYYNCIVSIVNAYNLTKYDDKMFKEIKEKKEEEKRKKEEAKKKEKARKEKLKQEEEQRKIEQQTYIEINSRSGVVPYTFTFAYDPNLPEDTIGVSSLISDGLGTLEYLEDPMSIQYLITTTYYYKGEMHEYGGYDENNKVFIIYTGKKDLEGKQVTIKFNKGVYSV